MPANFPLGRRDLIVAAAASAALWQAGTGRAADGKRILRRGAQADPETLDIHHASGGMESRILADVFEGLTALDAQDRVGPGVANRWTVSPDGRRYVFHLRNDARWTTGEPVTAEDYAFAWRRLLDPRTAAPYANLFYPIVGAEGLANGASPATTRLGVVVHGPKTIELQLTGPMPYLPGVLKNFFAAPIHRASFARHGRDWTRPGFLVGNGAFTLAGWRIHEAVRLARNPHYHGAGDVRLDEVHYVPTEDRDQEIRRYRVGELDSTEDVPGSLVPLLRRQFGGELRVAPRLGVVYFVFNLADPRLGDRRVRRALWLALDRRIIVEKLTRAGEIPAMSMTPPITPNYRAPDLTEAHVSMPQRLGEAKRLMAAAGYSRARPLKIEIAYFTSADMKKLALAASVMWKPLGVAVSFRNVEQKVFIADLAVRDFQVALTGWNADFEDPATFLDLFASRSGPLNQPGYRNPTYDARIAQAHAEADIPQRAAIYADAERRLMADAPVCPIYFSVMRSLVKPYVGGWYRLSKVPPPSRHLYLLPDAPQRRGG